MELDDLPRLSVAVARRRLAGLINRVAYRGEWIVLDRHHRRVAGVVPVKDLLRLIDLDREEELRHVAHPATTRSVGEAIARRMEAEIELLGRRGIPDRAREPDQGPHSAA